METIEILEKLVEFNTVSSKSNHQMIDYIEAYLKECGFRVTRVDSECGEKSGLFASIGPTNSGILLSAHTDVVPVEGQEWTTDPFKLRKTEDRLYGRGTTDMKGFLAASLSTAKNASKLPLRESLNLSISYDEEVGCLGIKQMIDQLEGAIGKPRACIVGEPTEMKIANGHKGKIALCAKVYGTSGHSAMAPKFVNALHLATDFVNELQVLQQWYAESGNSDSAYDIPYSTVHVGRLNGGVALNMVPNYAEILFEYRYLADDSIEQFNQQIAEITNRINNNYQSINNHAHIAIEEINSYPGFEATEDTKIVSEMMQLANCSKTTKVAFGTEAGYFSAIGIPTVVCGPGSMTGQGHQPDEYILVSQLAQCDAMLGRVVESLC